MNNKLKVKLIRNQRKLIQTLYFNMNNKLYLLAESHNFYLNNLVLGGFPLNIIISILFYITRKLILNEKC